MNEKSATLLLFFSHAIIFSILLFANWKKHEIRSSKWLAIFIFLCAMYITPFMLGYANWYAYKNTSDFLFFMPFQQLFLLPPILYFYTRNVLNPNWKLDAINRLHLLPAVVYFLWSLAVFITDYLILDTYYFYEDGRDMDFDAWYQVLGFISLLVYVILCLRLYAKYLKTNYATLSYADSITYRWLPQFLIALISLLCIRIAFFIINPEWANFGQKYWYYVAFSVLFYFISISGYIHAIKHSTPNAIPKNRLIRQEITKEPSASDNNGSQEVDDELVKQLLNLMEEEKVFRKEDLTLFDLASMINANSKSISKAINSGFKMNFNDFINSYRTKEVIAKIKNGEHKSKTILGLAFECGFNSKSTFNRAFKKHTNSTPRQFLEKEEV